MEFHRDFCVKHYAGDVMWVISYCFNLLFWNVIWFDDLSCDQFVRVDYTERLFSCLADIQLLIFLTKTKIICIKISRDFFTTGIVHPKVDQWFLYLLARLTIRRYYEEKWASPRVYASLETQGLLIGTMRYFRASDIFGAKVYFRAEEPLGTFSYQTSSRSGRDASRWLARKFFFRSINEEV